LADELAQPGAEVLVARSAGRVIGIAVTLAHHPDPDDPDPWIGLLMVHGRDHRMGFGRELTEIVEKRFRALGRTGVKLAVLDNNRKALSFWRSLGYAEVARRRDLRLGRDCVVLRKPL
ncbi:GNAT family N-acetyltransferase, partial [Streptomyces fradiae]